MTTIREALQIARKRLEPVSDSASLDAHVLLGEVLAVERAYLLAHPEQELTPDQQTEYEKLVVRCATGEPLPYVLGRRAFYDRDFHVTPAVLIPRPETELLLEQALNFMQDQPQAAVVDVGTGSGALAVTLAANCPQAEVYATDISETALAVARKNAETHQTQIEFMMGDLLQPLMERGLQVAVVMANLPYIATDKLAELEVTKHEPRLALDGGADGLNIIRRLLGQIPVVCKPGALILLEIGADQGAKTLALVREMSYPQAAEVIQDYAGLDRIVRILL
jgi:release factor glutamine methyltransferase